MTDPRYPDPRDAVLDFELVLALARRHISGLQQVTAVDETGGEARAYVLDGVYIFKTQRPHRVRDWTSLAKAKFHQDVLAERAPQVSVPRVLGYGREGDIEYVLETRMPGVAFRTQEIHGEERMEVLRELGRTLRKMHSVPLAAFERCDLFPNDDTPAKMRARSAAAFTRALQAMGQQRDGWTWKVTPEDLARRLVDGLPETAERAALHSNPGPEHVFVHPESRTFSGLIDFGDAYISHPAFDMRRWTTPEDRSALLQGYTDEGAVEDEFRAYWQVAMAASVMTVFALRPEKRAQALEDLRLLLNDRPARL